MTRALVVHDIREFGAVGELTQAACFGIALSQAIVNDYLIHRLPSGNPYLIYPDCVESYVGTLMEDLKAFELFDQAQIECLITEGTRFLRSFIEHIDGLVQHNNHVGIYPAEPHQHRVALILQH